MKNYLESKTDKKLKILLTGSTGFIGKEFINKYNKNYEIIRYSRKLNLFPENDIIIHCAGIAHSKSNKYKYLDYYESNYLLTKNIFDNYLKSKSKLFIFLSTIKVHDEKQILINENSPIKVENDYEKTKYLSEEYIRENCSNKKYIILRPCLVYGNSPKGNLKLLSQYTKYKIPWFFGEIEKHRSYCSINNILLVFNHLCENIPKKSGTYIICDDNKYIVSEFLKFYSKNNRIINIKINSKILNLIFQNNFLEQTILKKLILITEELNCSNKLIKKELDINLMYNLNNT